MGQKEIIELLNTQRRFFASGVTLGIDMRLEALRRLKKAIMQNEAEICHALAQDLDKSGLEAYMTEIGMVKSTINYMLKNARRLSKEKRARTPLAQFASHSCIKPCPLGNVLVISPWNYPLLLSLSPMIAAVAAGNTVILKPSAYAPHTSELLKKIIGESFPPCHVAVVTGGREENSYLLDLPFDHIFFTGSKNVGHIVAEKAARHLCPITLELGGKSPCIVDETADIRLAARRIVFGKFINSGQTCVAPDYVYCHESIKEALIAAIIDEINHQYPSALQDPTYGKMINAKHFVRVLGLIDKKKVIFGGECDRGRMKIEPTVIDNVTWDDAIMGEEIFGPLIPIMTYRSHEETIREINRRDRPLALYVFSNDKSFIEELTSRCRYGGGCINDTIIHLATENMPFGGVGESGMGGYHGRWGFETFTHYKSIVDKKTWLDLGMRYRPYTDFKEKLIRFFLK